MWRVHAARCDPGTTLDHGINDGRIGHEHEPIGTNEGTIAPRLTDDHAVYDSNHRTLECFDTVALGTVDQRLTNINDRRISRYDRHIAFSHVHMTL